MPNVLLSGPPGLGKSTFARAVAGELGIRCRQLNGPLVDEPEVLRAALRADEVVFVDEIHRLPPRVAEAAFELLDRGLGTLIGATTDVEMLPGALRNRFALVEELDYYGVRELAEIARRAAVRLGLTIDEDAALVLAGASRETPRRALALLTTVRDEAKLADRSAIDAPLVRGVLGSMGIDADGLDRVDRAYLAALAAARRPLSLGTLADCLGRSPGVLRRVHEPYLIRRGLIARTMQGRVLTGAGDARYT